MNWITLFSTVRKPNPTQLRTPSWLYIRCPEDGRYAWKNQGQRVDQLRPLAPLDLPELKGDQEVEDLGREILMVHISEIHDSDED